jgi:hypothetical protein
MAIVLGYVLHDARLAGRARGVQRPAAADDRPAGARQPRRREDASAGLARYFRYSLDHKVVGLQYLVGMIGYF